jgi:hypothetical protein
MPREITTPPVAAPEWGGGVHVTVTLARPARRRKADKPQETDRKPAPISSPRIPRITRLMALAIKFQGMLDCGAVRDYADLARLGYVTRARVTQIMNLLLLAPDIQEDILDLTASVEKAVPTERKIRSVAKIVPWGTQRRAWMPSTRL